MLNYSLLPTSEDSRKANAFASFTFHYKCKNKLMKMNEVAEASHELLFPKRESIHILAYMEDIRQGKQKHING